MIITTTSTIQNSPNIKYLGLVTGEAILGANIFRDLFAGVRDIVGGRSASYENELARARQIAIEEMTISAKELGANAIIGVDIDFETINNMLIVAVTGTAIIAK